jgi:hypothetical protein
MEKDYFRLKEEHGMNSEYYSDDDNAGQLQEQVREEMKAITSGSETTQTGIMPPAQSLQDDDYDKLFAEIGND